MTHISQCGKVRFSTESAAKIVMVGIVIRGRRINQRKVRRAYECRVCKGWHLTTQGRLKA